MAYLKTYLKYSTPALILLLAGSGLTGQQNSDIPRILEQKFQNWVARVPWEEIYIHSDRDDYIAGEDFWFNVYVIDRQTLKPSQRSRIAYVEMLNSANRPVVQKRIMINDGSGPGYLQIPDTLRSGSYIIRAYTNYMKNFLPVNCFQKEIRIYNVLSYNSFRTIKTSYETLAKNPAVKESGLLKNTGISIEINDNNKENLELKVNCNNSFRKENNDIAYLVIQTHGNIDHISQIKISGETTTLAIPERELTEGINQITIFDSKGKPVYEKYSLNGIRGKKSRAMIISPDSASARSPITLEIGCGSNSGSIANLSNLSISVTPSPTCKEFLADEYMILGSEFGAGTDFTRETGKQSSLDIIESKLKNLRSNWIDWHRILSDTLPEILYPQESEDHFLTGSLIDMDRNEKVANKLVLMCSPGTQPGFQYAMTDSRGIFRFRLHIDNEKKDLIMMPDKKEGNEKIIAGSSFSEEYLSRLQSRDSVSDVKSYIEESATNYQVRKIYGIAATGGFMTPSINPHRKVRFYGKPDIELVMADYVTLPKMEEVFFEILPHVSLRKKNKTYEVSVKDRIENTRLELSPVLFVDGVRITDASIIAGIDPAIVERIDVIKGMYQVGAYSFTGIVNVITKNANYTDVPLDDNMSRISYTVTEPVPQFISPQYTSQERLNSPVPDFRNTLYWTSSLKTGQDGKVSVSFWTSDIRNDYRICVQGFNPEGKLISVYKTLSVK